MAILDDGLNRVAALLDNDLYSVAFGTSATAIVFTDVALGGEVVAVEDTTPSTSIADNALTISSTMLSTEGNGYTYYETGIKLNGGATLLNRAVHAAVAKTTAIELVRLTDFSILR
jgi:hypothetical protein